MIYSVPPNWSALWCVAAVIRRATRRRGRVAEVVLPRLSLAHAHGQSTLAAADHARVRGVEARVPLQAAAPQACAAFARTAA